MSGWGTAACRNVIPAVTSHRIWIICGARNTNLHTRFKNRLQSRRGGLKASR